MFPGMNPRQMNQMMRKMGIQQVEIPATEVIIKTADGKELVIVDPQVSRVNMMGQQTLQIVGEIHEREVASLEISEEDVDTVVEQTSVSREDAVIALEKSKGDIAQAIMDLAGND